VPKKNFVRLLEGYARYATNKGATHDLLILGDGPDRPKLEALVDCWGIRSRVHMPGFQGYDLLPIFYGLASFFIHVSTVEQWGLVVNEAMAAGLPVIVSRNCGSADELVIDGVNGYKINPLDLNMITNKIETLAWQGVRCGTMGSAAREAVSAWGPARFAEGLVQAGEIALTKKKRCDFSVTDKILVKFLGRCRLDQVS
jgi:glycosyltransferase involved in cell wall biosynthesis